MAMSIFRVPFGFLRRRGGRKGKPARTAARPRLALEALEDRSLPSTTNVFTLPIAPNIAAERIQALDGNLFFTTAPGEIGRITPTGRVTPIFAVGGHDLAVGADGNLYTAGPGNTIERISPSGAVTDFAIPTPNANAESITASADGNIWFEETSVDKVGRLNPATGALSEFQLESGAFYEAPSFGGITAAPDGNVYVTQPVLSQFDFGVERISPDGTVSGFVIPANGNVIPAPEQITAAPDGSVYFTSPGAGNVASEIGRITPNGQVADFALPSAGGNIAIFSGITVGPDGNIYFNSSSGLGRLTLTGQVTENLSTPPVAGQGITVGPDGNIWMADAGQVEQVILGGTATAASTTTTLTVSPNPAVVGQTATLTATVSSAAGTPAGTVTFFDGGTALGSATLNASGQASLTIALGAGGHSLTASFGATSAFAASNSAAVTEAVAPAATTTALSASLASVVSGQSVTFTATVAAVAPGAGAPTGTVTFLDGTTVLGTVAVDAGGKAALTTSFSTTGSHAIKAVYNGDGNFTASSQTVTEQVRAPSALAPTTTALVASANPVRVGQTVTFTASVSGAAGAGTPTGTITFFVGNVAVTTVKLSANGKASLTGWFSVAGNYTITAVYSGDSNFAASSQSITEQVG
jgi:streptogramin lyase